MDDALQQKFPDLKPGSRPSGLGSVNGFGTTLVGNRDADAETETYVTTHCVTAIFVPVIALGAYRVASAPGGGWYILGRVPLSRFAKRWNALLLLLVLGLAGGLWWNHHIHTPGYVAGQKLREADAAAAAGQGGKAAQLCRDVINGRTSQSEEGKTKLAALIQNPPGAPSQAAEVYTVAVDLHRTRQCPVPDVFDRGRAIAEQHATADPLAALALLEVIAPYAPEVNAEMALRQNLLEKLVARDPNDSAAASRLAVLYEAKGEREKCRKLLAPHEARLGTLEGAAVLGRIYASNGQNDQASALLAPFVEFHLPAFQTAERAWNEQSTAAQDRVIDALTRGDAAGFDYEAYKRSDKTRQSALVSEYVSNQLRDDPALREARKQLTAHAAVIPATLDLGLVRLQQGQAATDPAVRKRELQAAEKTFLSVRSFAKESDTFRLNLGQVYYWLGRPAEGKKQFDELLAARGNAADTVGMVCSALREVGAISDARTLVEAAHTRESDPQKRFSLARLRSLLQIDLDDEIEWLTRSNPTELSVQAALSYAQGTKAIQDGDDAAAIRDFRKTIELNEKLPENSSSLNNGALAHFVLAQVTQDRAEFTRGLDKIDRAIALLPSDSILLHNAASQVLNNSLRDVTSAALDYRTLKNTGGWDELTFLYLTPAERKGVLDRLASHPGLVKARNYQERLMTLAPRRPDAYDALTDIHNCFQDVAGLKAVLKRVREADLDLTDITRLVKDTQSGKDDAKRRGEYRKGLARMEETLANARKKADRTFALAAARMVRMKYAATMLGESADADETVKLAEEAHAAAPSCGTETTLQLALILRAHATLAKQNAAYRALAEKTRRSFGPTLLLYAVAAGDSLAKVVTENPDVKRMAELVREEYRREPDGATPRMWAVLAATYPAEAGEVAASAKSNEKSSIRRQIERILNPLSIGSALDEFWAFKLTGRDADAKNTLSRLADQGIVVP